MCIVFLLNQKCVGSGKYSCPPYGWPLKYPEGWGRGFKRKKKPICEGGMGIFWNNTMSFLHLDYLWPMKGSEDLYQLVHKIW